jgi:hypothetical protein
MHWLFGCRQIGCRALLLRPFVRRRCAVSRSDGAWFGPYRAAQRSAMQCSAVRWPGRRWHKHEHDRDGDPASDERGTAQSIASRTRADGYQGKLRPSYCSDASPGTHKHTHTRARARAHTHAHTNPFMYTPHSPLRPQPLPNVGPRAPIPSPPIPAVQTGALRVSACAPIGLFVRRVRQAGLTLRGLLACR